MNNGKWKMKNALAFVLIFACAAAVFGQTVKGLGTPTIMIAKDSNTVFQMSQSPIISFRIQFLTGAADDPADKAGVANLTAAMLASGGSKTMTYEQIVKEFYPIAASFSAQTDKEMTTFVGQTHVDNLPKFYGIINQMLLDPGFREDDFKRLKDDAINFLKTNLREGNDEELGKERLYNIIYKDTAYENHSVGKVSSLEKLTLQDVKDFYAKNYTRGALVLGVSGKFDQKFADQMTADFAKL
ncbi:MAG: insulinase family protein, partial [Acidobacteriota bacterium]|nr:insulinase family protein [Acidobacteriota bacterium]